MIISVQFSWKLTFKNRVEVEEVVVVARVKQVIIV